MSNINGYSKHGCLSHLPHFWQRLTIFSMLAACTGCWEEIRYEPSQPTVSSSTASSSTESPTQDVQPDVVTAPKDKPVSVPLAEELFAVDDPLPLPTTPPATDRPIAEEDSSELKESMPTLPVLIEQQEVIVDSQAPESDLARLGTPKETETPVESPTETTPSTSSRTAIAVWQMSSQWSLAAAYFAKGLAVDRYGNSLAQAEYAANLIEIDLPNFPELHDDSKRQATIAAFLLDQSTSQLVEKVAEKHTPHHAALAELAIKTHALLLVYTPLNEDLDAITVAIRASAEKSPLPAEIWQPMVELLEHRGTFQEVKQAVFRLHKQAAAYLSTD